jgi:predicted negative regulator of RcsB-dependent stress response
MREVDDMSQEKVDAYKAEKKNRKKIMRREKIKTRLTVFCVTAVLLAGIGWFSWAVYNNVKANNASASGNQTELDLSAVTDYQTLLSEEASKVDEKYKGETASTSATSETEAVTSSSAQ